LELELHQLILHLIPQLVTYQYDPLVYDDGDADDAEWRIRFHKHELHHEDYDGFGAM
jgi:hypothetical protein